MIALIIQGLWNGTALAASLLMRLVVGWKPPAAGWGQNAWVPANGSPPRSIGQLWQAPVFVVGLAALVFTWIRHPEFPQSPGARLDQEIAEALHALEDRDHYRALVLAQQSLEKAGQSPQLTGDIHFVLGSAHLMAAEVAPDGERAQTAARALADLQQADQWGVAKDRQPQLQYRLAVAQYMNGTDSKRVVEILENVLANDPQDRLEGYRLLTRLYLAAKPPNLDAALRANEKLLGLALLENANSVRMQQGDILLRLKRFDEAVDVLNRIPAGAAEFTEARRGVATCLLEKGDWKSAALLLEQATGPEQPPSPVLARNLHALALCHQRAQRYDDAVRVLERIRKTMPGGEESQAASLQLGDVKRLQGRDDEALTCFKQGLDAIQGPYQNTIVKLEAAQQMVGSALASWHAVDDFVRTRSLAESYHRIATAGEAERCFAVASQSAGIAHQRLADHASGKPSEDQLQSALKYFTEAAQSFETVARSWEGQPAQANFLWAAAENFHRARQHERAAAVWERYLALEFAEKRSAEAYINLGEAHQALKKPVAAIEAWKKATVFTGPHQCRAKYLLAMSYMERKQDVDAEAMLQSIVKNAPADPEPAEYRLAMFAMGQLLFNQDRFAEAATQLQRAIELYAGEPQTLYSRYGLAEAYRQMAADEERQSRGTGTLAAAANFRKNRKEYLEKSLEQFKTINYQLADARANRPLNEKDQRYLRASRFGSAKCLYDLARYEEAITLYEDLAKTYQNRAEALMALSEIIRFYDALKKYDQCRTAVERFRVAMNRLDDSQFAAPNTSRAQWKAWLEKAVLPKLNAPATPATARKSDHERTHIDIDP